MKSYALLIVSTLAFSACATVRHAPAPAVPAKPPIVVAAKPTFKPARRAKSDLNGVQVAADVPNYWEIAERTVIDPKDGSAGAYKHPSTQSVVLFYTDQTPSMTVEDLLEGTVKASLALRDHVITGTGSVAPDFLWVTWSGEGTNGLPISGKVYVKRMQAPYDDVIVTIAGTWYDSIASVEEIKAVVERIAHNVSLAMAKPDIPTQRF